VGAQLTAFHCAVCCLKFKQIRSALKAPADPQVEMGGFSRGPAFRWVHEFSHTAFTALMAHSCFELNNSAGVLVRLQRTLMLSWEGSAQGLTSGLTWLTDSWDEINIQVVAACGHNSHVLHQPEPHHQPCYCHVAHVYWSSSS
jgi:hypothetical protein